MRAIGDVVLAAAVAGGMACGQAAPVCVDPPVAVGEMPNLDMLVGDTVETSLVEGHSPPAQSDTLRTAHPLFGHPCHPKGYFEFSYAARSADPAAVAVSLSDSVLTIVAIDVADSVRVDVTATDTRDSSAVHDFHVWVRPR